MDNVQVKYLITKTLPLLKKINEKRPDNPIIFVSLDGYSKAHTLRDWEKMDNKNFVLYGNSISREKDTAKNFMDLVSRFPNQKGLVVYHQAHILKNLKADGYLLDEEGRSTQHSLDHLGWVGFVKNKIPNFFDKLKIVLFDEMDPKTNPFGILDYKDIAAAPVKHGFSLKIEGQINSQGLGLFNQHSFLYRYRGGTIKVPKKIDNIFDGLVLLRP